MSETLKASASTLARNTTNVTQEGWNFISKTTFTGKKIAVETTTKLEDMDTKEVLVLHLVPGVSYDDRDYYKAQV